MADSVATSVDAAVAALSSKATHSGGALAIAGWAMSSQFVALIGVFLSIAGFATNLYFRRREYRENKARAEELHAAQMQAIRDRRDAR